MSQTPSIPQDSAGREYNDSNPLPVEIIAGGGGTSMTDDAAFTPGSSSVTPMGAVYQATPDNVDDGDVGAPRMSQARILLADVQASALPTGAATAANQTTTNGHLDGVETSLTAIDESLNNIEASASVLDDWDNAASDGASVSGDVAHDSADAGEPVKVGAKAYSPDGTTPGTAVAELDRTNLKSDLDGILYVQPMNPQNFSYHDDDTAAVTTDGTVKAAPGAGFAVFITDIVFSIGAATASSIFLEEGTTKILGPYYLEAIAGRGLSIHFNTPKRCTANTAILVTNTGSISFSVDILGFVAAV